MDNGEKSTAVVVKSELSAEGQAGRTSKLTRSAQVNHFLKNIKDAPPGIRARHQEIEDLPPRSNKRALKGEMISEFCASDSWTSPFFQKYHRVEDVSESSNNDTWISWSAFKQAQGDACADIQWKAGSCTWRLNPALKGKPEDYPEVEDKRELYQFKNKVESVNNIQRSTRGKDMEDKKQLDAGEDTSSMHNTMLELAGYIQEGSHSAKVKPQKPAVPPPEKDESKDLC